MQTPKFQIFAPQIPPLQSAVGAAALPRPIPTANSLLKSYQGDQFLVQTWASWRSLCRSALVIIFRDVALYPKDEDE